MKKSVAKSVQQNLCCAICLRTTRRHWRTTGATKDMKNPRMYADLGDCLHFDGLRWKSYCLGSVFAARIPVRCPFGASCAATRHRCSLSAFLNKSVEPAGSDVAQTAKQKNPHKAFCFGWETRKCATRPWAAPLRCCSGASSTSLRCPKSLPAILSNPRVRTYPQTAKQKGHREGGLFVLLAGRLGFEPR